jgi:hypothetical protein
LSFGRSSDSGQSEHGIQNRSRDPAHVPPPMLSSVLRMTYTYIVRKGGCRSLNLAYLTIPNGEPKCHAVLKVKSARPT